MEELEKYLYKKGQFPRVDFDDKNLHTFEIIKGKEVKYEDGETGWKMLVKEDGEFKIVATPSILIEVRKCQPGDIFEAQLKYRNIGGKTPIRDYSVRKIKSGKPSIKKEETPEIGEQGESLKEEIPIVEEGEGTPPSAEELDLMFDKNK